ncbi:DNA-binding pseudobarrel domain-containing protein [Dioscorea alata]|uniref:DNA-binding pseudobarrel domain-containing protein n=1 Tax=Dioscorea alata TaxID=55571 RepID=A0ACB7UD81_DIOAL|nr:DNA-binding pseudobarrel domain-containing protein [Dioscorea alata]
MAVVPIHVQNSVNNLGGHNPRIFAAKWLTDSDCKRRQNRLMLLAMHVSNYIIPQLTEEEKESADLPRGINLNRHPNQRNRGLPVDLYTIDDLVIYRTFLIRRATKGTVLKGNGWKRVVKARNLRRGDHVRLWSFRRIDNDKLCLLIEKLE